MKGIGKTQLLVNSLQAVETQLPNTKGVYFTFNGQGTLKDSLSQSLRQGNGLLDAFGPRSSLHATRVGDDMRLRPMPPHH